MDEIFYHKIDELVMSTGVHIVQITHDVLEKHQGDNLTPDLENGSGRGMRTLSSRARSLCS